MRIQQLNTFGGPEWTDLLSLGQIHLVCTAREGGCSIFQEEVLIFLRELVPRDIALRCIAQANDRNEVMTLHPLLNVSTLPLHIWGNRDSGDDSTLMKEHLRQCFSINTERVKSSTMVFCFDEQADYNGQMALSSLRRVMSVHGTGLARTVMVAPLTG